jgi:hypothetical protein
MHTVTASPAPFTTELRSPLTIDRSSVSDQASAAAEPSHIHVPRPRDVLHSAGEVTPRAATGR